MAIGSIPPDLWKKVQETSEVMKRMTPSDFKMMYETTFEESEAYLISDRFRLRFEHEEYKGLEPSVFKEDAIRHLSFCKSCEGCTHFSVYSDRYHMKMTRRYESKCKGIQCDQITEKDAERLDRLGIEMNKVRIPVVQLVEPPTMNWQPPTREPVVAPPPDPAHEDWGMFA